jgi:hypothetical protein
MLRIVFIVLLVHIITSCTYYNKGVVSKANKVGYLYNDFDTIDIRSMWILCSNNFRRITPQISPYIYTPVCDCMIDTIRRSYTKVELEKLSLNETLGMNNKIVEECRINESKSQL